MGVMDNLKDSPNLKDKVKEVKDSLRDSPSPKDKVMEDNLKVSPRDKLTTVGATKDKASHKIRVNGVNVATRASHKVNHKITMDMGASPKANLRVRLTMAGVAKDSHSPSLKDKMVMDNLKDSPNLKDKVMVDKDSLKDNPNPKDRVMEDNLKASPRVKLTTAGATKDKASHKIRVNGANVAIRASPKVNHKIIMDMVASPKANLRVRLTMAGVAKDSHNPSLKDKMVMDSLKDNLSPKDRVMEVKDNPRDNPNLKDKVMEVKDSHRDSPSLK